jgi:hypothetical protein
MTHAVTGENSGAGEMGARNTVIESGVGALGRHPCQSSEWHL